MTEDPVTFTILEDGMYLPSIGGVLPEGEYRGRIVRRDGKVSEVYITLNRKVLNEMGVDKGGGGTLNWNIINDYRAGMIAEDRA